MDNYFANLRAKRKALGICLSCGKHPSPCEPCREKNREYMRKKRAGITVEKKKLEWKSNRDYFLKHKFGITEIQYNEMLKNQNNACAICKSKESGDIRTVALAVDHCHKTGVVRGLLCASCNKAIGFLKDSVQNLESAIEYLKKNNCTTNCF